MRTSSICALIMAMLLLFYALSLAESGQLVVCDHAPVCYLATVIVMDDAQECISVDGRTKICGVYSIITYGMAAKSGLIR